MTEIVALLFVLATSIQFVAVRFVFPCNLKPVTFGQAISPLVVERLMAKRTGACAALTVMVIGFEFADNPRSFVARALNE